MKTALEFPSLVCEFYITSSFDFHLGISEGGELMNTYDFFDWCLDTLAFILKQIESGSSIYLAYFCLVLTAAISVKVHVNQESCVSIQDPIKELPYKIHNMSQRWLRVECSGCQLAYQRLVVCTSAHDCFWQVGMAARMAVSSVLSFPT